MKLTFSFDDGNLRLSESYVILYMTHPGPDAKNTTDKPSAGNRTEDPEDPVFC